MKWLTQDAVLVCAHMLGIVDTEPTQDVVTIGKRPVLVDHDPERRPIKHCPNVGAAVKPCQLTLAVENGYSPFIRIGGRRICLDAVTGLTDGTPPGAVKYKVLKPGQEVVEERT